MTRNRLRPAIIAGAVGLVACAISAVLIVQINKTARSAATQTGLTGPLRPEIDVDPNDPVASRQVITREEREKIGLKPHTWQGVIQGDVRATLDKLGRQITNSNDRLLKGRDDKAFDLLMRIRFQGMVYVEVETKKDAQRRVLTTLKASEFHVRQVFTKVNGFVGYASVAALDRLAQNPDVIGVCLDDKPLPSLPPILLRPRYNLDAAFKIADHVRVTVVLRSNSIPQAYDLPSSLQRHQKIADLQDRVLSTVTADDAWVWGRERWSTMMPLSVTKEALAALQKNPDVLSADMLRDAGVRFPKYGPQ